MVMSMLSWLIAIGVLALLIVVHELGHFAAARWQSIHVNRFSIGFGPALAKYQPFCRDVTPNVSFCPVNVGENFWLFGLCYAMEGEYKGWF